MQKNYVYIRMFNGKPMGTSVSLSDDSLSEIEFFINSSLKDNIDKVKQFLLPGDGDRVIEIGNDSLIVSGDTITIRESDENCSEMPLEEFKALISSWEEMESCEDREGISEIVPAMEILKNLFSEIRTSSSEDISMPVLDKLGDDLVMAAFTINAHDDNVKGPDKWCLLSMDNGSLRDKFCYSDYPFISSADTLNIEYKADDDDYPAAQMKNLLDLFDSIRYEYIDRHSFNFDLYNDYMNELINILPEPFRKYFLALGDIEKLRPEEPDTAEPDDSVVSLENNDSVPGFFKEEKKKSAKDEMQEYNEKKLEDVDFFKLFNDLSESQLQGNDTKKEEEQLLSVEKPGLKDIEPIKPPEPKEEIIQSEPVEPAAPEEPEKQEASEEPVPKEEKQNDGEKKLTFEDAMKDDTEEDAQNNQGGFFSLFRKKN